MDAPRFNRTGLKLSVSHLELEPQIILDTLIACDGDIDLYVKQFSATTHEAKLTILQKTFCILNKPEHCQRRLMWDDQIAAYKQAKISLAEREAFNWIGEYKPPKSTKDEPVPMNQANSFIRTWMGAYQENEKAKGRASGVDVSSGKIDQAAEETLKQMEGKRNNELRTDNS